MPNNPGRIDGDYSIGEHEQVKYVDPGDYGKVRAHGSRRNVYVLAAVVVALIIIALVVW